MLQSYYARYNSTDPRRLSRVKLGAAAAVPLLAFMACSAPEPDEPSASYRGGLSNAGVYPGPGLRAAGSEKWVFATDGPVFSSPAVSAGVVYAGSGDGRLYAIDEESGDPLWRFEADGEIHSSPAVSRGAVFFGTANGIFFSLDAKTGTENWRFGPYEERRFSAPGIHGYLPAGQMMDDPWDFYLSSPAVAGDRVVFGTGGGQVVALDREGGGLLWQFEASDGVHSSPAVAYDRVYAGSWDGNLYALELETGNLAWKHATGIDTTVYNQTGIQASPAVIDSTVFFGCRDANVYALDALTGREKWKYSTGYSWVITSPAVDGAAVFAATSDTRRFLILDSVSGMLTAEGLLDSFVFSSPSISAGMAYVGTLGGRMYALDAATGDSLWSFDTVARSEDAGGLLLANGTIDLGKVFKSSEYDDAQLSVDRLMSLGSILSSPVVSNGTVYFGSAEGKVYALD